MLSRQLMLKQISPAGSPGLHVAHRDINQVSHLFFEAETMRPWNHLQNLIHLVWEHTWISLLHKFQWVCGFRFFQMSTVPCCLNVSRTWSIFRQLTPMYFAMSYEDMIVLKWIIIRWTSSQIGFPMLTEMEMAVGRQLKWGTFQIEVSIFILSAQVADPESGGSSLKRRHKLWGARSSK